MNLLFRVLYVLIRGLFGKKIDPLSEQSELELRVLPNDLDTNLHMNNGRFLTIMDLGRLDLILRSGIMRVMFAHKSVPILSSAKIRYRLELGPFEPFKLVTKILYWDEKWFYLEQRFIKTSGEKAGATAAIALVKGNFYCKRTKSVMPSSQLFKETGIKNPQALQKPEHLKLWIAAENALKDVTSLEAKNIQP